MAENVTIYSNANNVSKIVSVDFVGDVLAASDKSVSNRTAEYYFKFSIPSTDTQNVALGAKVNMSLSDLALGGSKQSATDTANAYGDINSMIVDYTYDYINGHSAGQFGTSVKYQRPMDFTEST